MTRSFRTAIMPSRRRAHHSWGSSREGTAWGPDGVPSAPPAFRRPDAHALAARAPAAWYNAGVRRFGRYIFNGLTVLSLVLYVATVVLWVRSRRGGDYIAYHVRD